jgi:hypothetical protein
VFNISIEGKNYMYIDTCSKFKKLYIFGTYFEKKSILKYKYTHVLYIFSSKNQGSFFRLQNTEGLTLVGVFMEGTTLTCLKTYSDAKKRTLIRTPSSCGTK